MLHVITSQEEVEATMEEFPLLCHLDAKTPDACLRHNHSVYQDVAVVCQVGELTRITLLKNEEELEELISLLWSASKHHEIKQIRAKAPETITDVETVSNNAKVIGHTLTRMVQRRTDDGWRITRTGFTSKKGRVTISVTFQRFPQNTP